MDACALVPVSMPDVRMPVFVFLSICSGSLHAHVRVCSCMHTRMPHEHVCACAYAGHALGQGNAGVIGRDPHKPTKGVQREMVREP